MVKRRVYRAKWPTRYKLWIDVGEHKRRDRRRKPGQRGMWDQVRTVIQSWLRSVDGGTRRSRTSKHHGVSTLNRVHPNKYRNPPMHSAGRSAPPDEVAMMRRRRQQRKGGR